MISGWARGNLVQNLEEPGEAHVDDSASRIVALAGGDPAIAPSIARRWSPRASTTPPRRRAGTPRSGTHPASRGCVRPRGGAPRRPLRSDRIPSRGAHLRRARPCPHARDTPRRRGSGARRSGSAPRPRDRCAHELRGAYFDVTRRALLRSCDGCRSRLRPHAFEHDEKPGSTRVQPDAVNRDRGARDDRRGDEEWRGGRDVSRDLELVEPELGRALDGDAPSGVA